MSGPSYFGGDAGPNMSRNLAGGSKPPPEPDAFGGGGLKLEGSPDAIDA